MSAQAIICTDTDNQTTTTKSARNTNISLRQTKWNFFLEHRTNYGTIAFVHHLAVDGASLVQNGAFVCLFAWGLTTLSAQIGYIAP